MPKFLKIEKRYKLSYILIAFIYVFVASPAQVSARDAMFRAQNHVLYSDDCTTSDSKSGGSGTPFSGSGAGCGEQGYASGVSNSEANKKQIWSYFKNKGLSDEAVAGIMGNMEKESAFMPDAVNWIDCKGVVQWCYSRADNMVAKAAAEGKDWRCLDYQLDYIWYEITETSESQVMEPLKAATSPGQAANIFHDLFERSNTATGENLGRDTMAENIYREYTGKDPAPNPEASTSTGGKEANQCKTKGDAEPSKDGSLPDGECAELIERVKKLKNEGKILLMNEAPEMEDIERCGQVSACPSGDHVGIEKKTVQVLIAVAEQSGVVAKVYAFNKDHFCDKGEHGKGLAIDFPYNAGTPEGEKLYKFLYDNAASLGTNKLIYSPTPSGYECMGGGAPVSCVDYYGEDTLSGHQDHIHLSL